MDAADLQTDIPLKIQVLFKSLRNYSTIERTSSCRRARRRGDASPPVNQKRKFIEATFSQEMRGDRFTGQKNPIYRRLVEFSSPEREQRR